MHADHSEPFQECRHIFIEAADDVVGIIVDNLGEAAVYLVTKRIRKEPLQVPLDDATGYGVTFRYLTYIFYHLIDSSLSAHALTVVEGARMQDVGDVGCQRVAQQMVGDASGERCGEDFPPLWYGGKEGIVVVNAEGLLLQLTHHAHQ